MTWLEDEERQLKIEELKTRKKTKSKVENMYSNVKLMLILMFIFGIFALDAKSSIHKQKSGCDYTIVKCGVCGYEYYAEFNKCPCCGTSRKKK